MDNNIDTHRAVNDAFNRRDWVALARDFTSDAEFTDHPRGIRLKGPQQFVDWCKEWVHGFSNCQVLWAYYIDGGSQTICLYIHDGIQDGPLGSLPPSGRRSELPFCEILRYDTAGRIEAGEIYYDQLSMLVQLGHLPPLTGKAGLTRGRQPDVITRRSWW